MAGLEGRTLGDFSVIEQIGLGGMGAVYKARQISLDRIVALKVLSPSFATDHEYLTRFKNEACIAASLSHQNLVTVYAAGESEGNHYFVMEFVEGETVEQRLHCEGKIPPEEAVNICLCIAQGLDHAWRRAKLIHRDIKPANFYSVSNQGDVKLGDLGVARRTASRNLRITQKGMTFGTPDYISPEQARGLEDMDFRSDIYSLGCSLFHMLTGKVPYTGPDYATILKQHMSAPPPSILAEWPQCPLPLALLVGRMLMKDRAHRHQSYDTLIAEMRQVHAKLTGTEDASILRTAAAAGTPPAVVPKPPRPFSPTLIYVAVAAVVAAAGLYSWAPWKTTDKPSRPPLAAPQQITAPAVKHAPVPPPPTPVAPPVVVTPPAPAPPADAPPKQAAAPMSVPPQTNALTAAPTDTSPEAFAKEIAALPPADQVNRVAKKLSELNPEFTGTTKYGVSDGQVRRVGFPAANVTNISPVAALRNLDTLECAGTPDTKSPLADLSPLRGLPLKSLACAHTAVKDLAPLAESPLETLDITGTAVKDLTPLAKLKLTELHCDPAVVETKQSTDLLMAMGTLQQINGQPASELLQRVARVTAIAPFLTEVVALPAEQQVVRVIAKLKELNPPFDGKETHRIVKGVVTELWFSTAGVTDISPLRALKGLRKLVLAPWVATQKGALSDLTPLQGLPLNWLWCHNNPIKDLSPLRGMPLTVLSCNSTQVADLLPLTGMKLTVFSCTDTFVTDLAPLAGMPLTVVWCDTTRVGDLSPLVETPLREIRCTFIPNRDANVLRRIRTLTKINDQSAAMFWLKVPAPSR